MLLLHNCPEFVFSFLTASFLGVVATTANPFCTPHEIAKQLSASGARVIFTHSNYAAKLLPKPHVVEIEKWKVTVAVVVPPLVVVLAKNLVVEKYNLGTVRIVLSGAAPLGKELEVAVQGRLPQN